MYKKNPDFFADISGSQIIMINMDEGVFYLLPLFASLVFRFLILGKTIDEIKELFATFPEIPDDYAKRIDDVLNDCLKYSLIVESDVPDTIDDVVLNDLTYQDLQEEDFAYEITPSTDVQKLLMDDPIHDVSLDGWTPVAK
ncbi:MAG: hypothetical protein IKZ49_00080 [Alphaproteobacteria bacterium]|nr:hypothetical protein [Alphaproteobacteria bacterium]